MPAVNSSPALARILIIKKLGERYEARRAARLRVGGGRLYVEVVLVLIGWPPVPLSMSAC